MVLAGPVRVAFCLGLLLGAVLPAPAQDLDVVLYAGGPGGRTILDQIEDPTERAAFQKLFSESDPAMRRGLAEGFIARFPRSWLLSHAYEVAAKASIDRNDLAAALRYGQASLALLPENPLLLVPLANVQVHEGLPEQAARSAADALDYLDRFYRPGRFSAGEWARLEPRLRASAHYVLGRVAATRGLAAQGDERTGLLAEALASLKHSTALNAGDGLGWYLRGVVEQAAGKRDRATASFALASALPGPMQSRALEFVREAHGKQHPEDSDSFEGFLLQARRSANRGSDEPASERPAKPRNAEYAGSASCQGCHPNVFDSWSKTGMARMFRPYEPQNVIGDFTEANEFTGAGGKTQGRMFIEEGRHFFELSTAQGPKSYPVDYTIGSKWQQAYGTRLPDGRIHVFPLQYNLLYDKWVNFWEIIDAGHSERSEVGGFHRLSNATSYQLHCAACHTSQVRAEGRSLTPDRVNFREAGINCEMCHGPSQAHAQQSKPNGSIHTNAASPPIRFGELDHERYVAVCAQCHLQSGITDPGPKGELNYSGEQVSFLKRVKSRPYSEFSLKAFYMDGRFRETTFIVESFVRSACYREGKAHCGSCHDPHPADAEENPTSLKFREQPNRICVQCHEAYAENPESHARHKAGSEASRCTSCHMPKIMNSMMFQAGTHRIDDVPNAAMTARFGRDESPNACLRCHEDETQAWLSEQLGDW